MDKEQFSHKDF